MPVSSVETKLNVYLKENRVHQKQGRGTKNEKVTDEARKIIRGFVDEKCDISQRFMRLKIVVHFCVTLSMATINKFIKSFHYFFKIIRVVTERSQSEDIQNERQESSAYFQDLVMTKPERQFFFIDEAVFSVCMRSRYA